MRALLIDPKRREVEWIILPTPKDQTKYPDTVEHLNRIIGCELLEPVPLSKHYQMFVDEEGLLTEAPCFTWEGLPQPIAGRAVILAWNDQVNCYVDVPVSLRKPVVDAIEWPEVTREQRDELCTPTIIFL